MDIFISDNLTAILPTEQIDVDEDVKEVDLTRHRLLSIANFDLLPKLEVLTLRWNLLKKIEHLNGLHHLTKLSLYDNQALIKSQKSKAGLSTLHKLVVLNFIGNAIRSIEGLGSLTRLMDLALSQNGITRISGLCNNLALTTLDLNDNRIEKIENLHHLSNLNTLWMRKNRISNWSEVAYLNRLPALKVLTLEMNPIYSTQHFYRNRIREILPNLQIIDAVPINWISGDPWQELSFNQ
ncbi:leucine Rich repeat-containing domain protein [Dictyocaulus viviparus]|uniref:Leucine Rich repeat-containing domain protein n=1 Tax=Dictyocaulus viviparus TaxID=29172 RepID=A0A0D8Y2C8_DICVI|nr:leucine Rich repeat-containing domain protein [Dictyocaulus viviparus]